MTSKKQSTDLTSVKHEDLLSGSYAVPLSEDFLITNGLELDELVEGQVCKIDYEAEKLPVLFGSNEKKPLSSEKIPLQTSSEDIEDERASARKSLDKIFGDDDELDVDNLSSDSSEAKSSDTGFYNEKHEAGINKSKMRTMDSFRTKSGHVAPLKSASSHDLTRSVSKETNKGVNPNSRFYIRGVLNKRAGEFMFSVCAFIMFNLCVLAGFLLPLLLILDKEKFAWAVYAPILIIVGILIYFMFSGRATCPVCNQKQFAPKNCLKHRDAHKWPIVGYMLPTALHAAVFKWFKCIFCGTSIRLKE